MDRSVWPWNQMKLCLTKNNFLLPAGRQLQPEQKQTAWQLAGLIALSFSLWTSYSGIRTGRDPELWATEHDAWETTCCPSLCPTSMSHKLCQHQEVPSHVVSSESPGNSSRCRPASSVSFNDCFLSPLGHRNSALHAVTDCICLDHELHFDSSGSDVIFLHRPLKALNEKISIRLKTTDLQDVLFFLMHFKVKK